MNASKNCNLWWKKDDSELYFSAIQVSKSRSNEMIQGYTYFLKKVFSPSTETFLTFSQF